ncbi:unnamed protein product [Lampetra planeri]
MAQSSFALMLNLDHLEARLRTLKFYHGKLPRHNAEALLLANGTTGSFLLRRSKEPGKYAVSVRTSSNVIHFVAELNVDGEVTFGQKKFSNMEKFMIHLQGQPMVGSTEAGTVVFLSTPYPGVVDEPSIYTRLSIHHEGGTYPPKMPMTSDRVSSLAGKSGYMVKQGGRVKSWKKRWFVLERNELKYYNNQADDKPIDTLRLSRCSKVEQDISQNKGNCFRMVFPERTYYMHTTTPEEREHWMELLQFKLVRRRFRFYDAALSLDLNPEIKHNCL